MRSLPVINMSVVNNGCVKVIFCFNLENYLRISKSISPTSVIKKKQTYIDVIILEQNAVTKVILINILPPIMSLGPSTVIFAL